MLRWLFSALPLLAICPRLMSAELAPIPPGPSAVACTNLEATPHDSGPMFDFLNGKTSSSGTVYLTDILVHPEAVPTLTVDVPSDGKLFGKQAGTRIPLVLLIVYPTTQENPRPDYTYPYKETRDALFTHMQQPGGKPILADPAAKYPLIIYTGGYNTHGLWHLWHLKELAAHGYIVVDMFHGDGRGASFASNLALRSIELRATLDYVLQHSDFASAIDAERIGATGESAGGHTVAAALGGIDPSGRIPEGADPRIKAGVGLVPFLGGSRGLWPFKMDHWYFGEDHAGLRSVRRPFLGIYAEKDGNVPPEGVEAGVREMAGPTTAVMLDGERHLVSTAASSDICTWEVLFFDAWLRDDATARQKLKFGTSVRGGVNDHKTFQHEVP
jgi:predicted dienelactone hydrolase